MVYGVAYLFLESLELLLLLLPVFLDLFLSFTPGVLYSLRAVYRLSG